MTPAAIRAAAQLARAQPDSAVRTAEAEIRRLATLDARASAAKGAMPGVTTRAYLAAGDAPRALKSARDAVATATQVSLDAARNG